MVIPPALACGLVVARMSASTALAAVSSMLVIPSHRSRAATQLLDQRVKNPGTGVSDIRLPCVQGLENYSQ